MKRIFNKYLVLGILIGLSVSIVSVYAATTYLASDVKYKDTTVESALNELYSLKRNTNFTYYGRVAGGANDNQGTRQLSLNYEVAKGKYIIFYTRANRNDSSLSSYVGSDDEDRYVFGTLNGCDEKKVLTTALYGSYKDSGAGYANIRNRIYLCSVNDTKTITFTSEKMDDDINHQMIIYEIK